MIKVNANYFKAASLCMSREDTRYYLNGVYIEPCAAGGATLTATDGHRIVCIHDKDGICDKPAIVGLPNGALKKKMPEGEVIIQDDGLFRHGTFISMNSVIVDGSYPDYRRVVLLSQKNGLGHKGSPGFQGRYIGDFGKVGELLCQSQSIRIMPGPTESDPALVLFPSAKNAFGIIMPMRVTPAPEKFDWFIAGPAKPKKAKKAEPKEANKEAKKAA